METIQSTYRDVFDFFNSAQRYLQAHEENNKFRYAVTRSLKSAGHVVAEYQDKTEAISIKHCLAADGGKGEILREPNGQYKFTKEAMLKRNEERTKLFASPVKLEVHFCVEEDLPKDFSLADRDTFLGFVIRDDHPKEKKK